MTQTQRLSKNNTTITRDNETKYIITLHSTQIVKVYLDGKIILDSGGWKTHTTKTRMNQASNQHNLGYQVYQKDFAWFVSWKGKELPFIDNFIVLE